MGLIVKAADFTGKYTIAQTSFTDLDSYILKYEERYLIELLGVELFDLFKADIATPLSPPTDPIYLAIYNPIREDDSSCIRISEGMKEMLLGFIYFEYQRDIKFYSTPSGTVVGQSEVARESSGDENYIYGRYNEAVKSYNTIQWYIRDNETEDYPTFNGHCKQISSWL